MISSPTPLASQQENSQQSVCFHTNLLINLVLQVTVPSGARSLNHKRSDTETAMHNLLHWWLQSQYGTTVSYFSFHFVRIIMYSDFSLAACEFEASVDSKHRLTGITFDVVRYTGTHSRESKFMNPLQRQKKEAEGAARAARKERVDQMRDVLAATFLIYSH